MGASVCIVEEKILESREERIKEVFDFLTKELMISSAELVVTIFGGWKIKDVYFEADLHSEQIWEKLGVKKVIPIEGKKNFTYLESENEPAGPRCEIFVDRGDKYGNTYRYLEIATTIFESYKFGKGNKLEPLEFEIQGNAFGVERLSVIVNNKTTIFDIPELESLIEIVKKYIDKDLVEIFRKEVNLLIDYIRSIIFIFCDGQLPDTSKRGQRLKKLIRNIISVATSLNINNELLYIELITTIVKIYEQRYPELSSLKENILPLLENFKSEWL